MSLLSGLVAHWRLEESSGTRYDAHGTHHLSEYLGSVTSGVGKIGSAALFAAAADPRLQRTPVDGDLSLGSGDFTLAFWARASVEHYGELLGWIDDFFIVYTELDGTLAVQVESSYLTFQAFPLSAWHFVVLSYDSANSRLYSWLNNSGPIIRAAAVTGGHTEFNIGGYYTNYGTRRVDSVSFWNRFISETERNQMWNGGAGYDYPFDNELILTASASGSSLVVTSPRVDKVLTAASDGLGWTHSEATIQKLANSAPAGSSLVVAVPSITKLLNAAAAGSSVVVGVPRLTKELSAAAAGSSVVVAVPSLTKPLSASAAGSSVVVAVPSLTKVLSSTATGLASVSAQLTRMVSAEASSAGSSETSAEMMVATTEILLAELGGRSDVAAELSGTRIFVASASGATACAADVVLLKPVAAAEAVGTSSVVAEAHLQKLLVASSAVGSTVAAEITTDHDLIQAVAIAWSSVLAEIEDGVTLTAQADGVAVVSIALRTDHILDARPEAASTIETNLTVGIDIQEASAQPHGQATVTGSLEVSRILVAVISGVSVVQVGIGGLFELEVVISGTATVSAAMPVVPGPPYWFGGSATGLGFTQAVEVVSGATKDTASAQSLASTTAASGATEAQPTEGAGRITSRHMIKLARAVNDRLRSGLGDGPWRIAHFVLGLFREMRNPSEDGWRRPAWAEFFEAYQPITPEEGEWPLTGPGDPEGANVDSPLGAYLFGNAGADVSSEAELLNGIPLTLPDGRQPATMAESWLVKKLQMGAADPVTGAIYAPAWSAARAWGAIRYSRRSPHLTSYGGWLASPDLLETGCDDPDEFDGAPPPPNYEIKFSATTAGQAAGYVDKTYAGTCAVGPSISPPDKYDNHVAAVVDTPWEYYVVLNSGSVETLPRWAYVEGPYMGQPKLRKITGDQLCRALARGASEWRGDRQDATARSALEAGAVDKPKDWLVGAFDAQAFGTRQYPLAPVLGRATTDGVAGEYPAWRMDAPTEELALSPDTTITPLGPDGSHVVADGAVVRHLLVSATDLLGECSIGVLVDRVQVVACTLSTEHPGEIVALPTDVEAGSTVGLVLRTAARFSAGGRIEAEMAQQIAYKPDLSDLICVLRRSAPEIEGPDYALGNAISTQLNRYGFMAPPFTGHTEAQTPTRYTGHPVYEAARRWSRVVRLIPRRQLVGYAVENGKSVLWFRRQAMGVGGASSRVEIVQGTGGIVPGQEYAVEGSPGDQVQYPSVGGPIIEPGGHFVGSPDDNDFLTNGSPTVYAVSSGILDQAIGGDLFGGIVEQVRHVAPEGGFTNEWLLGVQLKPYHPSQSSMWKPEVFADRYPLHDRAAFFSVEIANELDQSKLWHCAYGLKVKGLFGGNLLAEWPTGYRYAPLTSAWSGLQFLNQITVDGIRWPTEDDRQKFYRSARIYEPDLDIASCEAVTEGTEELVKITLTGRLHNTHGEVGGAPASIPRDMSQWSAALIAARPYRSSEDALMAYLLHSSTGVNFGPIIGDHAANSYVQDLPDNPYASIYPHFYLVKLVPEPFEDGNDDEEEHDTPLWHDSLAYTEMCIAAMCPGYVDHVQSTEKLLEWVEENSGTLPESWGLHDYTYPELCRQAFGGAWAGMLPTVSGDVAERDVRPDLPHGYGPWPNTYATPEVFNRLVKLVNLLTRVRLMVPYTYEVKQDGWIGSRVHQPQIEVSMTGNVAAWVDRCDFPLADTPDAGSSVDWAENTTALSMSTGSLGAQTVDVLDLVTEVHAKVVSSWRVSLADGIEDAFPPFVAALFDASNVSAIGWFERTRQNHTRTAVAYADSEPCDGNLGWYTDAGQYFAWPVGPIDESETWADITSMGTIEADPPPASDCGLGRTASMPNATFEGEGVGSSSLQVYFLPGSTLFLDVPLLP